MAHRGDGIDRGTGTGDAEFSCSDGSASATIFDGIVFTKGFLGNTSPSECSTDKSLPNYIGFSKPSPAWSGWAGPVCPHAAALIPPWDVTKHIPEVKDGRHPAVKETGVPALKISPSQLIWPPKLFCFLPLTPY